MNQRETRRTQPALLMTALCCYAAGQWMLLSSIGGCRFFNPHHREEVAAFYEFDRALAVEMKAACASGQVHDLLFSDNDVALPYVLKETSDLPDCRIVRETAVTPFSSQEMLSCSAIFISEEHPPQRPPEMQLPGMQVLTRWHTSSGEFGYTVYHRSAACFGDGKVPGT